MGTAALGVGVTVGVGVSVAHPPMRHTAPATGVSGGSQTTGPCSHAELDPL